jgi:hypothetical protein
VDLTVGVASGLYGRGAAVRSRQQHLNFIKPSSVILIFENVTTGGALRSWPPRLWLVTTKKKTGPGPAEPEPRPLKLLKLSVSQK